MKKLLYIAASDKPEEQSISRQTARRLIQSLIERDPDMMISELALYETDLPEPHSRYFSQNCKLVSGPEYDALSTEDKEAVDRINALCSQFEDSDLYIIAAPMWSLSFPSRLKQYIDCVLINNRLIRITKHGVDGLLDDRERSMVYIQSSGGVYPRLVDFKFNYGVNYVRDLFHALGIKCFHKLYVQGTEMPDVGPDAAVAHAQEDFDDIVEQLSADPLDQMGRGWRAS